MEFNDPIISIARKGTSDSPFQSIEESLIVDSSAKVQLTEYPHRYNRVIVTGDSKDWYETDSTMPDENSYHVDYLHKIVTFNIANIGKQLQFKYEGIGKSLISANNIYTERDGLEVVDTLQTLTDTTKEARDSANQTNENIQQAENVRVQNENTRKSEHTAAMNEVDEAITTANNRIDEVVEDTNTMIADTSYIEPYNATTTYKRNNVVSFNGHSFIAKQDTKGNPPPDPEVENENDYWGLAARKGADGTGTVKTPVDTFTATEGQKVFTLRYTYDQFQGRTKVTVGGVPQFTPEHYEETSSKSITLNEGVPAGTIVKVEYFSESVPLQSDIQNTVDNHTGVISDHASRLNNHDTELNSVTAQLAQKEQEIQSLDTVKMDKNTTDISVQQINKNKGLLDETYFADEVKQQWAGNTPIHLVPADKSITTKKLAFDTLIAKQSKNLFDKNNITMDMYIRAYDGRVIDNANYVASDFIKISPSEKYTPQYIGESAWYDSDKVYISGNYNDGKTIESPTNAEWIRLSVKKENIEKAQFEKGIYQTAYESGSPKLNISDSVEKKDLEERLFDVPSKNLFDKSVIVTGKAITTDTGVIFSKSNSFVSGKTPLEITDYAINEQVSIAFFDVEGHFISGKDVKGNFIPPNGTVYAIFSSTESLADTIQLEKGTVSTPYYTFGRKISVEQIDTDKLSGGSGNGSEFPFASGATVDPKVKDAIKDIVLYGTNKDLKYRIRAFRRKDSSSDGNSYWVIEVADSNDLRVTQWTATNYQEPNTLEKLYFYPLNNSGVSGHIWIDWSKLGAESYKLLGQSYAQMGLDEMTYIESDESNAFDGNMHDLWDFFWKGIKSSSVKVRNAQTYNTLTFPVITDNHIEKHSVNTMASMEAISALAEYTDSDFIAHLGDMIVGDLPKNESLELVDRTMVFSKEHFKNPLYAIKGNHDRNDMYLPIDDPEKAESLITNKEWYQAVTRRCEQYGIVGDENNPYGGYYYVDFPRQKIRAIFQNTNEMIETNGVPDLPKYSHDSVASYKQLKWHVDKALNFTDKTNPSEWAVVMMAHIPNLYEPEMYNYGVVSEGLKTLVNALRSGGSGTISAEGQTINYDFSGQGSLEFIAHLYGHVHQDIHYVDVNGVNHFMSNCTLPAKRRPDALERDTFGEKTMSTNTFVIDRTTRKVKVIKTGTGVDHEFTW